MSWQTLKLPTLSSDVTAVTDTVLEMSTFVQQFLTTVKDVAELASNLAIDSLNPAQIAIKASAALLEEVLNTLLSKADPGLYILAVPPRGIPILPPKAKLALGSQYVPIVSKDIADLQTYVTVNASIEKSKLLRAIQDAPTGNAGFVRTVLDSLSDPDDVCRPQMGDEDYVAGVYLVTASQALGDAVAFMRVFNSLILPKVPQALTPAEIPVPRMVTARQGNSSNVLVSWDLQLPVTYIPQYSSIATVTEVAIIRSDSAQAVSATTVSDLFGTNTLKKGMTGVNGATVVDVVPFASNLMSYIDSTALDPGKPYYYAASFHVKLSYPGTTKVDDLGFDRLSGVAKTYLPKDTKPKPIPRSMKSTPPDWYRTPRIIDLIPGVADLVGEARNFIKLGTNNSTGYADLLKTYVTALEQQILSYAAIAEKIRGALVPLKSILTTPLITGSVRAFSGTGGVGFIRRDLIDAFSDEDPNRPADNQFTTGLVILATTPTAASLLNGLLGIAGTALSDIAKALEQIDRDLAALEAIGFTEDMSPGATSEAAAAEAANPLIGDDPSYCYQSYSPDVSFGDDFKPRS